MKMVQNAHQPKSNSEHQKTINDSFKVEKFPATSYLYQLIQQPRFTGTLKRK